MRNHYLKTISRSRDIEIVFKFTKISYNFLYTAPCMAIYYYTLFFVFQSEPVVDYGLWKNKAESCLAVAYVFDQNLHQIKKLAFFREVCLIQAESCLAIA